MQSLRHPSNEMFETKLRQKTKRGKGVSIMSGEINSVNKFHIKTYDQEKLPYAGSSIEIPHPGVYRYPIKQDATRNNPMSMSYNTINFERDSNATLGLNNAQNQTFNKSRNVPLPKRMNSMERILDWNPKANSRLNLINEQKNISMERSLKNTIPFRQHDAGK